MQNRKVTYKLYTTAAQVAGLLNLLHSHKNLWNAALEERIDAWAKCKKSISYEDQCKSLTQIRCDLPEDWATVNCSSQQITLRRLDKAFKAFYARCAKGQSPGFPRFKSIKRMPGFGFKGHGDGYRFTPNLQNKGKPDDFGNMLWSKHGVLRIAGVGHIRVRGQARAAGIIKSCELIHKKGTWFVSITLECAETDLARARKEDVAMGADWGVNRLLTIIRTDGALGEVREDIKNPRWFKSSQDLQQALDRSISSKKKYSNNWRKACASSAKFKAKQARKRHDHQHQLSAELASRCALFATESLTVRNMTASAAGTLEEPGRNVAQKSGLNREILDTAPTALFQKIAYKVLETGGDFLEAPTRSLKPSQTCPQCGSQKKKTLSMRVHLCTACGHTEDRDAASARVNLRWALGTLPRIRKEKVKKSECGQELSEVV
jgi:putative transposase